MKTLWKRPQKQLLIHRVGESYMTIRPLIPYTEDGHLHTCVLDGPTARRGTLISNPPLGSFSPLRQGSFGGSRPPSQSQIVFRIA